MKKVFHVAVLLLTIIISLNSCNSSDKEKKEVKPPAVGSPYELLVICSQEKWAGEVGDSVRAIMGAPVEMLNQPEPLFTISRIVPNNFSGLLTRSRNILNIITGEQYTEASINAQYNVYSAPQLIVTVSGPDNESIVDFMSEHRTEMTSVFGIAERDRGIALNTRYKEKRLSDDVKKAFGIDIDIPKGYKKRDEKKDFIWLSNEYPTASQGIVIYRYPYHGKENFTADSLVKYRNQFTALIPGENPGSHMTTSAEFTPSLRHFRIHGRYWAEMRGFWDVENDYMGGPFVSYSTLDTENRMVVTIDCYVFSPQKPKRNFLRHLEHVIYSVRFPGDKDAQTE